MQRRASSPFIVALTALLAAVALPARAADYPVRPIKLVVPYAAITQFVDPAVDFGLQFQATVADMAPTPTEDPDNDEMEQGDAEAVGKDDGSNVVTVDFGRKK